MCKARIKLTHIKQQQYFYHVRGGSTVLIIILALDIHASGAKMSYVIALQTKDFRMSYIKF